MISKDKIVFPDKNIEDVHGRLFVLADEVSFIRKYKSAFAQIQRKDNLINSGTITKCRESFFYYFYPGYNLSDEFGKLHFRDNWCFFQHKLDVKKLDKFISIVERILKIPKGQETVFSYTNSEYTCVVRPSKFWTTDWIRYGFFTLFLRCASDYYNGEEKIFAALSRYSLAQGRMKFVIEHFLRGNTKPTFDAAAQGQYVGTYGVYYHFYNKNEEEIKELLVSSPTSAYF